MLHRSIPVFALLTACTGSGLAPAPGAVRPAPLSPDVERPEHPVLAEPGVPDPDPTGDPTGNTTHPDGGDTEPAVEGPSSCGFTYADAYGDRRSATVDLPLDVEPGTGTTVSGIDVVAHAEPAPPGLTQQRSGLVMPTYTDDLPVFERAEAWSGTRCYELPDGSAVERTEAEAWALYRAIAEHTTGVPMDTREGVRSVVGVRGAYPGTLHFNGNTPDKFNDTLVLLWVEGGEPRVREFPVTTETGARDFGYHSSSQLRPNRRYSYVNGWHRGYNALSIAEWGYRVRDDANGNGHWDSDRNGWLDGGDDDHGRVGSAHNIHMGSPSGSGFGDARIRSWSAGCQVMPGAANWDLFIHTAWEGEGTPVDYFLVDVRDIAPRAFGPCGVEGGADCPVRVDALPFTATADTTTASASWDGYNCSTADESGPERVYALTVDTEGVLTAWVEEDEGVDVDVHILEGSSPDACLDRGNTVAEADVTPGRYWVVVDSWSDGAVHYGGGYTLQVELSE